MREILFKVKELTMDYWHEGLLTRLDQDICHIKDNLHSEWICKSETICQYTGLTDKNGRKIFEGDIVRRKIFESYIVGVVVWFDIGCCGFYLKHENSYYPIGKDEHTGMAADDEVIGNIFENPEMLEEKITGNVGERC